MTLKEFFDSSDCIAINCDTKEKAVTLLKAFDKMGKKWIGKDSYLTTLNWFNRRTCYSNKGTYAGLHFYKRINFKLVRFEDIELGE